MAVSRISTQSIQQSFPKGTTLWDGTSSVGSMDCISSITLTGSQSIVEFNSIPQTYTHLQLRGMVFTSGATNPTWLVNNDSTTANYKGHHLWGTGTSPAANDQSGTVYWNYNPSSSYPSVFIMDWLDYTSTSKNKTMRTLAGSDTAGGTSEVALWSGVYMVSNTGITSIKLNGNGQTFSATSTFALYGIK